MSGSLLRETVGDVRGRALWVVLGCLVCQSGLGFSYVLGPLAGNILDELGWTRAAYSSARAPQLFVIAAASPLVGALAVRFGAKRILVAGTAVLAAALLLFAHLQHLWQMTLLVALLGLSVTALGDITVGHLVATWVERGRGLALGLVYTGSNLGGWLLVPAAAGIAARQSWREAFTALGLGALGVLLPAALLLVRERRGGPIAAARAAAAGGGPAAGPADLPLSVAVRTRSFWILAGSLATFFFYFLGLLDCLVLFLTDRGMAQQEAARHFGRALGLGMVSKVALGLAADRIPHKAAAIADYALLAASSLLLLALPSPVWMGPFVVAFGFATAARDVVSPLLVVHCFGVRHLASIYGALMLVLLPGGALGPIFAAAVHDRFGSYHGAFVVFAALNVAATLSLGFVRCERTRRPADRGRPVYSPPAPAIPPDPPHRSEP